MATYTCKRCGKQFELAGFSNYCYDCRHRKSKCVICGKEFEQKDVNKDALTCSKACWGKWRKESGQSKAVAAKSLATKNAKYGKAGGFGVNQIRKCAYCGKEFKPESPNQIYCKNDHFGPCPVCGKDVLITDFAHGPRACSEECRVALITKLARERDKSESVVKYKETMMEKYGVENYSQTEEWKEKVTSTNKSKFGTEWAMQNAEFRQSVEQSNIEKYGVSNPAKLEEIKQKSKDSLIEKYGGMGWGSEAINSKIQSTNLAKYGAIHPCKTLQCKSKSQNTSLEKYGFNNYSQTKERLAKIILDPSKIDEFWNFRNDPEDYIFSHYNGKPYVEDVAKDVGVNETSVYDILIKHNCKNIVDRSRTSVIEREMYNFLKELLPESDIIQRDRRTIAPYEFDFYIPKHKFAIECNPTFTHNSSLPSFGDPKPKQTVYHKHKTDLAEKEGVFLFHVFGYDWAYRREIIKSMIRASLGKTQTRMYARDTVVKEVPYSECSNFLLANHRQGPATSKINLGLYTKDNDELVSVMTFGKLRNTIGKTNSDPNNSFELIRFCNLLNTSVVGGASKLFKHFITNYNPEMVMSFSDRAHTKGKLYPILGFEQVRVSEPGYVWVNIFNEEAKNRVSCQKHNLPNLFDDVTQKYLDTKSEQDIMIEHGFAKVFDSGTIRWEWHRK